MKMAGARVVSTSTVKATSHPEPIRRFELSPWDLTHLQLCYMQQGVLFHKPATPTQIENSVIHHLRNSLSRTLDLFFPLAGRLAETKYDDDTYSFSIICNNAGAEFVYAVADGVTIAEILEPVYVPPFVWSLFPLNGVQNYQGISIPLLAVQVTELADGIFIGCTMNHVVADGISFWHFFNCWSEVSRGFDSSTNPPIFQRRLIDGTDHPFQFHFSKDENLWERLNKNPQALRARFFHFTQEKIAALKSKANSEMGTDKISSLQALLAHLVRSIFRNRRLEAEKEILYGLPVSCRSRLQPPLPSQYFGNSAYLGFVKMKVGELLKHGPAPVALQMNTMIDSQTDETIKNMVGLWAKELKSINHGEVPEIDLVISNSPRFNVYGTDFGWGRPIAVRNGAAGRIDGLIVMFPGVEEGSIDIEACLLDETLEAMGKDPELMDAVTIY